MKLKRFGKYTFEDIVQVVENNNKQRFALKVENGLNYIRANQGHSIKHVDALELTRITSREDLPGDKLVIHGTYMAAWKLIRHQGLSKMKRNHIHFAIGEPGSVHVISGIRRNVEVLIYINLEKALEDGYEFYLSNNHTVLSSGKDGILSGNYFEYVLDAKTRDTFDKKYPNKK